MTIVVATLNEAHRIAPCLEGLIAQGPVVREILIVDSGSTDATVELVRDAMTRDARIRLLRDDPLPDGWVGKVWALQHGLAHATADWMLGIDADTEPKSGMAAGALAAAMTHQYDAVSFSPRFVMSTAAERWLQPALLVTLIYRFGAAGTDSAGERVMANGQCFLARRVRCSALAATRLRATPSLTTSLSRAISRARGIASAFSMARACTTCARTRRRAKRGASGAARSTSRMHRRRSGSGRTSRF